jgi:hypothetical protein
MNAAPAAALASCQWLSAADHQAGRATTFLLRRFMR